ncbi:hypothetical protein GCM10009760_23420 [Kitasatospora kazusensis]|uniref:Uncharacterized protein n=1 Tax=Kitasatospora kazusensis TaxID=407974 RepID=A0ABN2ZCZ1_9ACTN
MRSNARIWTRRPSRTARTTAGAPRPAFHIRTATGPTGGPDPRRPTGPRAPDGPSVPAGTPPDRTGRPPRGPVRTVRAHSADPRAGPSGLPAGPVRVANSRSGYQERRLPQGPQNPQPPPKATNLTLMDQTNSATGLDLFDLVKGNCPP